MTHSHDRGWRPRSAGARPLFQRTEAGRAEATLAIAGYHGGRCAVPVAAGSLFLSHLNDSGFWIVKDFLGLSVSQTLRTWTVCETIVGIAGMLLSLLAFEAVSPR